MPEPADTLFAETNCFRCYGDADIATLLRLALLARIYTAQGGNMTLQELVNDGACYRCFGLTTASALELVYLRIIGENAGTPGPPGPPGGSGSAGVGSPEGVVTASPGQSYVDSSNGEFYFKLIGVGNTGWFGPYISP